MTGRSTTFDNYSSALWPVRRCKGLSKSDPPRSSRAPQCSVRSRYKPYNDWHRVRFDREVGADSLRRSTAVMDEWALFTCYFNASRFIRELCPLHCQIVIERERARRLEISDRRFE